MTKEQAIKNVIVTMRIENMDLDHNFINELIKVSNGEKTSEQLRQEIMKEYKKKKRTSFFLMIKQFSCFFTRIQKLFCYFVFIEFLNELF